VPEADVLCDRRTSVALSSARKYRRDSRHKLLRHDESTVRWHQGHEMNWEAVSAISDFAGVIAVVISLIYVAAQIRQNSRETKLLRTQSLISANTDVNVLLADNAELAHLTQKGWFDYKGLSADEQWRFGCLVFSVVNQYDFAYHQYMDGQLEETFWKRIDYELPLFLALPGGRDWWEKDKSRFSTTFVKYLDTRIAEFEMPDVLPTLATKQKQDAV
jgi:hypothetical protein